MKSMLSRNLEVHNKAGVSNAMLSTVLAAALELLTPDEIKQIRKVIIAPGKKGPVVNFVTSSNR